MPKARKETRVVRVSVRLWDIIEANGRFGETPSTVLDRLFGIEPIVDTLDEDEVPGSVDASLGLPEPK